ncbi:MAG: bifunctional diaminohydroxyphosphoribosylaminopyrimidine deaminase/5-amino-6-(5-phosphoribosylamino)uracil reductase RibD [Actinomycetes bacterium]
MNVVSDREVDAMRRALELAASDGVPYGPNPRVGAVLLDVTGAPIAEGFHRGAGTAHAEVDALANAGERARGGTAIVTLEPCNHTGRTGPCVDALIAAGISRVVFAQTDPNPLAAGGAERLVVAGIEVIGGVLADDAAVLNQAWTFAVTHDRPFVTWKSAATLDGRVAASDGSSRWITSAPARADVHEFRSRVDAVVVGIGTVLADDPQLSARGPSDGSPYPSQPLRVVVGMRDIPSAARVRDDSAPTLHLRMHDPLEILDELNERGVRHVMLEGGPNVVAAFVSADVVDAVRWYVAPALLGSGPTALGDIGITSIAAALRLDITDVVRVGTDIRIDALVRRDESEQQPLEEN